MSTKGILFIVTISLFTNTILLAQEKSFVEKISNQTVTKNKDSNEIICDERINKLMNSKITINESNPTIEGYRVQIYFASGNNSRKMVNDVRTKFLTKYPNTGAYEIWQAPNFKVRVGDYRTKLEAYKFYKEIKSEFPSSFIVKDNISLPKLD